MVYGHQAIGVPPTAMQKLRRSAANATGILTQGRSTTTLIHLVLGEENDPEVSVVRHQVREWMWLLGNHQRQMGELNLAWRKAYVRFRTSDTPWNTVTGPLSATIAMTN